METKNEKKVMPLQARVASGSAGQLVCVWISVENLLEHVTIQNELKNKSYVCSFCKT